MSTVIAKQPAHAVAPQCVYRSKMYPNVEHLAKCRPLLYTKLLLRRIRTTIIRSVRSVEALTSISSLADDILW